MSECPGRPSSWILLYIDQIFSQLADAIKHLTSTACHSHGLRYISESEKRWLFFLTTGFYIFDLWCGAQIDISRHVC